MVLSTSQLRVEYGADCTEREAKGAQEAWDGLSDWQKHYEYKLRKADTGSRACRAITGGTLKSLHAAFLKVKILLWNLAIRISGGVACDFNWQTNPYGGRLVTDMPREMVDAICGMRTRSGKQIFRWGGYYTGNKDAMHYELVCSKEDLATGVDPKTLPNWKDSIDWPRSQTDPEVPDLDTDDKKQLAHIEKMLVNLPRNGMLDWGTKGGDLNGFGVTSKGEALQLIYAGKPIRRVLVPEGEAVAIFAGPWVDLDSGEGQHIQIELKNGKVRWLTFDATRAGFPGPVVDGSGNPDPNYHLVKDGEGWHYFDI